MRFLPVASRLDVHLGSKNHLESGSERSVHDRRSSPAPYSSDDVERLRGSVHVEHTLARLGAERLRTLLAEREWVAALGAMTGGQAVQMVQAGLEAIYLSGWQVAADANLAGGTYPDQSLYPANSGPALARRISSALLRADQIAHAEGDDATYWLAPIVADAEAGFGGPLNAFEIMKAYIEAGAAAVHFEDQLSSEKKCGHLGGKVLVPTSQFVRTLVAARLAADVARRADADRRPHRRALRLAADERRRRGRPRVLHRRAHRRRASSGSATASRRRSPAGSRTRRTPTSSGARPRRRTSTRPSGSPPRSTSATRASSSPTTARRRSTGAATCPTGRSPASSATWRGWATASSSSRWPASTRSTSRCSSSRAATATTR